MSTGTLVIRIWLIITRIILYCFVVIVWDRLFSKPLEGAKLTFKDHKLLRGKESRSECLPLLIQCSEIPTSRNYSITGSLGGKMFWKHELNGHPVRHMPHLNLPVEGYKLSSMCSFWIISGVRVHVCTTLPHCSKVWHEYANSTWEVIQEDWNFKIIQIHKASLRLSQNTRDLVSEKK